MKRAAPPWLQRPGLAGGIDKDGSRAAELLALGFGSVEFGTVSSTVGGTVGGTAGTPPADSSLAVLAARLGTLAPRPPGAAIGIGIGLPAGAAASDLPACWLAGLLGAWPLADYLSFNLSALAYRPLLAREHLPLLAGALAALAAERERLPRRIALALKFPLGGGDAPLPAVAQAAGAAGFDILTAVLPEDEERYRRLAALARSLPGPALVAVGGIRRAADVAAARAAGAAGVQVHRAFAEGGAACLPALLGD